MNTKILMSILVIGVVAAVAGAGTWAVFTDTETSSGNTFTAGTLTITLGTVSWTGTYTNMKPGDTVTFKLPINSGGSLPLNYTITPTLAGDLAGGDNHCTVTAVRVDTSAKTSPYTDSLSASGGLDPSDDIEIDITMPTAAGNEYQGKTGSLTVVIDAAQQ